MAGEKAATLRILGNNLDAKEKLKQIREEADRLRKDSPELTVRINRAQARAEMAVLKEQFQGVRAEVEKPLTLTAQDVQAVKALDDLSARVDVLKAKRATITVDAEDKAAVAKVAALDAQLDSLNRKRSDPKVAVSGIAQALAEVAALDASLDKLDRKKSLLQTGKDSFSGLGLGGAGRNALMLGGIGAAIGPAPVMLGGLTAGLAGVTAALVPAIAGLGLFGAVAASGIAKVEEANQKNKKLSGGLGELQTSVKASSKAWADFQDTTLRNGGAATMAHAIGLIPIALKAIQPILAPTEKALNGLFGKIGKGLQSSGFKSFVGMLSGNAGKDINLFASILGHLGSMFGKVVKDFQPFGQEILGKFNNFLSKADKGTDNGIQRFLNWLHANGPTVIGTLKNLGTTLGNLWNFLSKFSGFNIAGFSGMVRALAVISGNPIGAGTLIGLLVLTKVVGVVGPMIRLALAFKELSGAITLAKLASIGLMGVGIVGAIVAIITVTVLLVQHWGTVKKVASQVWHAVLGFIKVVWNWVKKNWPLLLGILLGPVATATVLIIQHWHQIESGAKALLGKLVSFFRSLPGKILGALGDLGHLLWNAGLSILQGLLDGLIAKWDAVKNFVGGIASWIGSHKGPIEVDAVLLRPHGQAIMGGLIGGLQDGMPGLAQQLSRTTSVIANTRVPAMAAAASAGNGRMEVEWVGGNGADREFITWLKKNIRLNGGNPDILGH